MDYKELYLDFKIRKEIAIVQRLTELNKLMETSSSNAVSTQYSSNPYGSCCNFSEPYMGSIPNSKVTTRA
jgi:hypothetical protein